MFKKKKKNEQNIFGIVGLGRFGSALANELFSSADTDVLVMDTDEDSVRAARDHTEYAYVVKGYDKKTLAETGIQNCDVVAVCIGEKIDASILITMSVIDLGVPKVIAEAASAEHGEILEKLGAEVVYPERDIAIRLAHRLETSKILDYVQLSEKVNISKMLVPESLSEKQCWRPICVSSSVSISLPLKTMQRF